MRHDDDPRPGLLVLADGTAFEGELTGPVPGGDGSGQQLYVWVVLKMSTALNSAAS